MANRPEKLQTSPETPWMRGIPATATRGWLLWNAGRTREAIKALTENLAKEPQRQDLQTLLGICLLTDDQPRPAAQLLKSVVTRSPGNPVPRFHLAHALLHLGKWEEGWDEFETSRFGLSSRQSGQYDFCSDRLWVDQDLAGKVIVIEGEQGFGDQIQFIRFAGHLKEKFGAAGVHFSCHPALSNLMQSAKMLDSAAGKIYRDFDYHVPVMSLPHRCGIRPSDVLFSGPYLRPDPESLEKWKEFLPRKSHRPRIGICWRSDPMDSSRDTQRVAGVNFVKTRKSLKPDDLLYLLDVIKDRADVVSLQIASTDEEVDRLNAGNVYHPKIGNFTDTAAIIALCDQVITIDTAAAHLAGAIGVGTQVLLSRGADWRWAHERDGRSAWYPGTQLHRQKIEHSWESPIASAVEAALSS